MVSPRPAEVAASLCRGDVPALRRWLERPGWQHLGLCLLAIALGAGAFGAAVGSWRSPRQAAFNTLKLPLLFVLTAAGTGALNVILAKLAGVPLRARQSLLAVLLSFSLTALILGSLAPPVWLMAWSLPGVDSPEARLTHRVVLLATVAAVACAGVTANVRLFALLKNFETAPGQARRTLAGWLAANLFLGAQLSWNLRPFFGTPGMRVQLLRDDPFDGTFYEAVYLSLRTLLN